MAPPTPLLSSRRHTSAHRPNPNTYPPTRSPFRHHKKPTRHARSRSSRPSLWRVIGYQTTFAVFILVLVILLLLSAYGIGEQAIRGGLQGRWNIFVLAAAYAAVAIISAMFCWSRLLTIKRLLRAMPKPYMPTKYLDLEKTVADHIMSEYSRTAVIAHISQATTGEQEGWGRPGTKWEDKHFRTEMLSTLPDMHHLLLSSHPRTAQNGQPPLSLASLNTAAAETADQALILFVNSYIRLMEQARYARREPSEGDAEAVVKVVEVVRRTMEVRRSKERSRGFGQRSGEDRGRQDAEG